MRDNAGRVRHVVSHRDRSVGSGLGIDWGRNQATLIRARTLTCAENDSALGGKAALESGVQDDRTP